MEVMSENLPFSNKSSATLPTRCETVLKFKGRVIELNVSLIKDNSFTFSDNSFDEHISTSNNGTKPSLQLDIAKCFVLRKSSGFVAETPRTSTPLSVDNKYPTGESESSISLKSSQSTSKKTRKPFVCKICKKTFVQQFQYKKHNLTHKVDTITTRKKEADPPRIFECKYCGKAFELKASHQKHEKNVHMPGKMYACGQCPKIYNSSSGLREHRITKHDIGLGVSCKMCGKTFVSKKKMDCHIESYPSHAEGSGQLSKPGRLLKK